ncbi:hypothetical protein ACIGAN_04030 [Streptomyces sp. NPDC085931]|uniref:hypothetical protein n=1 Tax=Streptomyces sp. NPDC085931 TaxID=3365740 RepID=UPI0037CFAABD
MLRCPQQQVVQHRGDGDGIVDAEYGKAFAAAIPAARFTLLPHSGHLPQIETPGALLGALLTN